MKFIHERDNWTDFRWDANALMDVMAQVNLINSGLGYAVGYESLRNRASI